jgi:LPXTG-site transpeptidase (sortase) family protein
MNHSTLLFPFLFSLLVHAAAQIQPKDGVEAARPFEVSVTVDVVQVYATVRDRADMFVAGLSERNFEAYEEGAHHRDTFFRPLRNVVQDDVVTLTTMRGEFRYRVVSTRVVVPSEISVLKASAVEMLTLVTCYPFYFVGSAPSGFIVRAERVM